MPTTATTATTIADDASSTTFHLGPPGLVANNQDVRVSLASDPRGDLIPSGVHISGPDPGFFGWGTPLGALSLPIADDFPPLGTQEGLSTVYNDEFVPLSTGSHLSVESLPYATGSYGSSAIDMLGFTSQSGIRLDNGMAAAAAASSRQQNRRLSASDDRESAAAPRGSSSFQPPQRHGRQEEKARQRVVARSSSSVSHPASSQGLMAACNSNLVTDNLLRIYHDVLENNLACWLAEHTCPYTPKTQTYYMQQSHQQPHRHQHLYQHQHQNQPQIFLADTYSLDGTLQEPPNRREWGSVWSNQMYRRVKDLDRAARANGLIYATRAEDQAASKALNLAIMAFATQWAQGGRRRERFPTCPSDDEEKEEEEEEDGSDDLEDDMHDEFEKQFQLQLWEGAKRALEEVAGVESFKVVYAELIFGLIQRPWFASRPVTEDIASFGSGGGSVKDAIFMQIRDIINEDGPPVYLDRASRKIRTLRARCDTGASTRSSVSSIPSTASPTARPLNARQKATVALLYWLAVMFDTVSSSINQRPVVVADEDCQHGSALQTPSPDACTYTSPSPPSWSSPSSSHRWDLSLFSKDNPDRPLTLRWPCEYDEAAEAVTRSAAVKVLLYRYISYLQNAMGTPDNGPAVEEIILSVTRVHRYWDMTHGTFFRDLIRDYDTVPARIKSWFPCIQIPWLLGSLLVTDLIDVVDENGLGTEQGTATRAAANVTAQIRRASASELADVARVTTPQEGGCGSEEDQLPSYHFAVNEGTLLTEPWTVLLIRAFAKACIYHLSAAEDLRDSCEWEMLGDEESAEYTACLGRSTACVKALWFLGRKSEMARRLSLVFVGATKRLQTRSERMGREFWAGSPV